MLGQGSQKPKTTSGIVIMMMKISQNGKGDLLPKKKKISRKCLQRKNKTSKNKRKNKMSEKQNQRKKYKNVKRTTELTH